MLKLALVTALAFAALTCGASAQTAPSPYAGPVAVVVAIPIPAGLSRAQIEGLFKQQAPAYAAIPTLKQKYFTVNEETHRAGGVYLWENAAAARAFYSDQWKARVAATYGAPAELTWFDAPLVIQGKAGMAP